MSEKVVIVETEEELPSDYIVGQVVVAEKEDGSIKILKNMENALNDFKDESERIKKSMIAIIERMSEKEREYGIIVESIAKSISNMGAGINEKETELLVMKDEMIRLATILKDLIEVTDKKIEESDTNLARTNILLRNAVKVMQDYQGITKKDVADTIDEKLSKMDYHGITRSDVAEVINERLHKIAEDYQIITKQDISDVVEGKLHTINKNIKELMEKSPKLKATKDMKKLEGKVDDVISLFSEYEKFMRANAALIETVAGSNEVISEDMKIIKSYFAGLDEKELIFALGAMKIRTKKKKLPPWASARMRYVRRTLKEVKDRATELAIIGALIANEELGVAELAGITGIDVKVIAKRINSMVKEGRLGTEGKGKNAYYTIKK